MRASPAGRITLDVCSALTTSPADNPLAASACGLISMMICRSLPPNGAGVESPGMVNRPDANEVHAVVVELLLGRVLLEMVSCATGTFVALNWITLGGVMPGGAMRRIVLDTEEICAMAAPMSVPGWK
jgi:hypothetical protein